MTVEDLFDVLNDQHPDALKCAIGAWKEDLPADKQVYSAGILALYCEAVLEMSSLSRETYEGVIAKYSKSCHLNTKM